MWASSLKFFNFFCTDYITSTKKTQSQCSWPSVINIAPLSKPWKLLPPSSFLLLGVLRLLCLLTLELGFVPTQTLSSIQKSCTQSFFPSCSWCSFARVFKQSQIVEHFGCFQTWVVFLGGHVSFLWDKSPGAETQSGVCQGVLSCKGDALLYSRGQHHLTSRWQNRRPWLPASSPALGGRYKVSCSTG